MRRSTRRAAPVSFYAIDYAARMAMEMGADVVKLNMPEINPDKDKDAQAPYNEMDVTQDEAISAVRRIGRPFAGRALGRLEDRRRDRHSATSSRSWQAGGSGVIFGRNVWQREWNEALEIIAQIKEILLSSVSRVPGGPRARPDGLRRPENE